MPVIGGTKCIVAHPTKILGGHGPPAAYPTAPHMGSGERCKLPERGPQSHFAALYARKTHHSGCSIFGSLVSIAMSRNMKANPGSGRIWYLLATYAI